MPFEFLCPQGHRLLGVENQVGQPCQCPICGVMLVVPAIGAAQSAGQSAYAPATAGAYGHATAAPATMEPEGPAFPQVGLMPGVGQPASAPAAPDPAELEIGAAAPSDDPNRTVRVLCPNKHELHTPMDMLGMDAMCPQCQVQFRLRYEDSIEYRERKLAAQEQRERRFSKAALNWAIVAAVLVFCTIIGMIIFSTQK